MIHNGVSGDIQAQAAAARAQIAPLATSTARKPQRLRTGATDTFIAIAPMALTQVNSPALKRVHSEPNLHQQRNEKGDR